MSDTNMNAPIMTEAPVTAQPPADESLRKLYVHRCFDAEEEDPTCPNVIILSEKAGVRGLTQTAVCDAVTDHLVGLDVLERLGYPRAAQTIRTSLPTRKRIRSGNLGEVLASDYIEQKTEFVCPVKRLRYSDDRDMSMRGDDGLAIQTSQTSLRVLKVEVKSRARLSDTTVAEASEMLMKHSGRPSPSTLNFVLRILRREQRDDEADLIESLQTRDIVPTDLKHMIFTFSGNHPRQALAAHMSSPEPRLERQLVGLYVEDHQELIETIFETLDATYR